MKLMPSSCLSVPQLQSVDNYRTVVFRKYLECEQKRFLKYTVVKCCRSGQFSSPFLLSPQRTKEIVSRPCIKMQQLFMVPVLARKGRWKKR